MYNKKFISRFLLVLLAFCVALSTCPAAFAQIEELYLDTLTPTSWYGEKVPVVNTNMKGEAIAFADAGPFEKGVSFSNAWVGSLNGFFAGATYDISGYAYNRFSARVGSLTDYISEEISMYYAVMVDGKPLEVTEWMTHSQGSVVIDVEIPVGAQTLELRSRAIPHNSCATLCFADAKLYNGEPDPVDDTIYVSDLTPVAVSADGGIRNDVDCIGSPIAFMDGYTAEKGIGMAVVHNPTLNWHASATYDVSGLGVNHISARVGKGMDYYDGSVTELIYTILADGQVIAVSEPVSAVNKKTVQLEAFFPEGTRTLEFRMQSGNTNSCGTGSFANAVLSKQENTQQPKEQQYLSDLTPKSWYGEKEPVSDLNMAGGQIAFVDGKTFSKGVSFSANLYDTTIEGYLAGAVYDVSGFDYNHFTATVGSLTDYTNDTIQFVFTVWADGKVLYISDRMGHADGSTEIDVFYPTDTKELEIRMKTVPHPFAATACFADAKIDKQQAPATDENAVYLSNLTPTATYGDVKMDLSMREEKIAFDDGVSYQKGVSLSAMQNAEMGGYFAGAVFDVSDYSHNRFTALAASMNDFVNNDIQLIYTVLADGSELYTSPVTVHADAPIALEVFYPVGTQKLELRVQAMPHNSCATVSFANAKIDTKDAPLEDAVYFSSLTPTSWYGEKEPVKNTNMVGGVIEFADGKTFMNGVSFSACHNVEMGGYFAGAVYDVSAYDYNHFTTTVGSMTDYVNDEVQLTYTVYADGKVIATVGPMLHADGSVGLEAWLPDGTQTLELRVQSHPHNFAATVCFANAKLNTEEPPEPEESEDCVYISDLTEQSWYGEKAPVMDLNMAGGGIAFADGKTFTKGVSFSACYVESKGGYFAGAVFDISAYTYDRFTATVGSLTDYVNSEVQLAYTVLIDGAVLLSTDAMLHADGSLPIKVAIPQGAQTMELRVESKPHNFAATVSFADAKLYNSTAEDRIFEQGIISYISTDAPQNDGVVTENEYGSALYTLAPKTSDYVYAKDLTRSQKPATVTQYMSWDAEMVYLATVLTGTNQPDGYEFVLYPNLNNATLFSRICITTGETPLVTNQAGELLALPMTVEYDAENKTAVCEIALPLSVLNGFDMVRHGRQIKLEPTVLYESGSLTIGVTNVNRVGAQVSYSLPAVTLYDMENATVYLSDLTPIFATGEGMIYSNDRSFTGTVLATDDDRTYEKGVEMSAARDSNTSDFRCTLVYDISAYPYNRLCASVGSATDYISDRLQYQFIVLADGEEILCTEPLWHADGSRDVLVQIPEGTRELTLIMITLPDNICGTGIWGDVRMYKHDPCDMVDGIAQTTKAISNGDVATARALYNELSATARSYVHNYDLLLLLETDAKEEAQRAADQAAAKAVDEQVVTLGTNPSADQLAQVQVAYEALTEEQKALMTKEKVLNDLTLAAKQAADQQAADLVIQAIKQLKPGDMASIMQTRQAYEQLSTPQKQRVTNINVLVALEQGGSLLGDVNADGTVSSLDALMVLQAAVNKLQLTESQGVAADVNADGEFSAVDALIILRRVVNKDNNI